MGLLKNLFGGQKASDEEHEYKGGKDDIFSPRYKTIRKWIESEIGKIDLKDPNLIPRMKKLHEGQVCILKAPLENISIYYEGNHTIFRGETRKYEKQIKRLGFRWDKSMKAWVVYDQRLKKEELMSRCLKRTSGLQAYIQKVEYRQRLEGK